MMEKYQGPWFPREAPPIPPADPKPLPDFTAIRLEAEVAYPSGMQEFVRRTVEFQTMRCERFLEEVLQLTVEERATIVAYPDALPSLLNGTPLVMSIQRGFGKKRIIGILEGIMEKAENPPLSEEQIKHRANHWKLYEDPVGRALVEEILRRKAEKNG
ncbi:hypothetical protein WILDE_7 [Arthrobacter phage Wilde]|uniref:Uncharacterized protein n=1 Tax=Arthrobacter phage Wilde TaxID=1772323 RepID=A0A0U4B810_9CAUD|nr:hypothetical protein WILDE_7 [Arthrobacter phage Wilde]